MAVNHIGIVTASAPRAQELRNLVATGVGFRNLLNQLTKSMAQYGGDSAGYAAIEADFGLAAGNGQALAGVIASAQSELSGGISDATFAAQLIDRAG